MNMTKVTPVEKCKTCACLDCASSEIGRMYVLNSALDNAYSILGVGLVFFDKNKNVTHLNELAKNKLKLSEEFILLGQDFISECLDEESQHKLRSSMDQILSPDNSGQLKLNLSIKGESTSVMLQKLENTAFGINAPGFVMFMFGTINTMASSLADVARIFGLTEAEAKLTLAIVNGMTAAEYAEKHGVSINTVYSQIKQALAKTGTRRQAELVRLVLEHSPGFEHSQEPVTTSVLKKAVQLFSTVWFCFLCLDGF